MLARRCLLTVATYGRVATRAKQISVGQFESTQSERVKTSESAAIQRVFRLNKSPEKEVSRDLHVM